MWIALEGVDTSGKSTQIALLQRVFKEAIYTQEPGGTPLGVTLRHSALHSALSPSARFLLFLADRALHLEEVIKPNAHKLIFSDRCLISGLAYAPYSLQESLELHRTHQLDYVPDAVFFLSLKRAELIQRLRAKSTDCIESQGVDFLLHTQARMLEACALLDIEPYILEAGQSEQAIHSQILEHLHALSAL
ncbi:dTMP kinase [Helicobacter cynogastricus]|uniref:dTMP kinase n=1 Tax=Helicobacter cynogastricus TaxID=329937 RepID=UPI000CF17084|nr:dTMP kinase [Helicobacter cynogastricus]